MAEVARLDAAAAAAAATHGAFHEAAARARSTLRAAARKAILADPCGAAGEEGGERAGAAPAAAVGPPGARPPAFALWRAGWYEEIAAHRARVAGGGPAALQRKVRERERERQCARKTRAHPPARHAPHALTSRLFISSLH